jgi:hypothetical protein
LVPSILFIVAVAAEFGWAWCMDRSADANILVFLGLRHRMEPRNRELPLLGDPAPDCTFRDLDGQEIHLRDLADHKPVVVEFGGFT